LETFAARHKNVKDVGTSVISSIILCDLNSKEWLPGSFFLFAIKRTPRHLNIKLDSTKV